MIYRPNPRAPRPRAASTYGPRRTAVLDMQGQPLVVYPEGREERISEDGVPFYVFYDNPEFNHLRSPGAHLIIKRPLLIDADFNSENDTPLDVRVRGAVVTQRVGWDYLADLALRKGRDGVIIQNFSQWAEGDEFSVESNAYIVFDEAQVLPLEASRSNPRSLRKNGDAEHSADCTGWHQTANGQRRCMACNRAGVGAPGGPPPWHTGPWLIDEDVPSPTAPAASFTPFSGVTPPLPAAVQKVVDLARASAKRGLHPGLASKAVELDYSQGTWSIADNFERYSDLILEYKNGQWSQRFMYSDIRPSNISQAEAEGNARLMFSADAEPPRSNPRPRARRRNPELRGAILFDNRMRILGHCQDTPNAIAKAFMEVPDAAFVRTQGEGSIDPQPGLRSREDYEDRMGDWNYADSGFVESLSSLPRRPLRGRRR